MKDYSTYYENAGLNEKIKRDGYELFELTLQEGYNSYDISIDGSPFKAVIYNKYVNKNGSMYYILTHEKLFKKGSVIEWDSGKWLVMSRPENNSVYDKAEMQICNSSIDLKGETKQVQVGVGSKTGKPIYETIESPPLKIPCIAEKTITKSNTDEAINMPEGTILITIPYVEHEQLDIDKELVIYDTKYKIIDVDDTESINGVGLRRITGNRVV